MEVQSLFWIRYLALAFLLFFTAYTLYCMKKENFWKSLRDVYALKWGKQVILDLYLGLFFFSLIVYLHEGSFLIALLWILPALVLGNLVPLLYLVLYFPQLAQHFA